MIRILIIVSLSAFFSYGSTLGDTWFVRQDGTGDAYSISWGLYLADAGDTIFVGPGLYRQPPIYLEPVHLISEQGANSTILEIYATSMDDVHVIILQDLPAPCSIIGFTIRGARNGFLSSGGGICCLRSAATIRNNILTDNWCQSGGGLSCDGPQSVIIEGNLFHLNGATAAAAIEVYNCSPVIRFNTIVNNHASDGAGGIVIYGEDSFPIISHNIVAYNGSSAKGAVHSFTPASQITFSCNDVWNNTPGNYEGTLSDQTGVNGNISLDPLFCGVAGSGNYYLRSSSPCAADNVSVLCWGVGIGCYPMNCTVETRKRTWGDIKSLFKEGKQ